MRVSDLPSFEKSMMQSRGDFTAEWKLIKESYERNFAKGRKNPPKSGEKIPKIIHQIWLGSPLPDLYRQFGETWKKHHPDWEYRLWTDESAAAETLLNRELYDKISNFGAKSDILRYEVLNKYGGLYIDTDFYCLKPFDPVHNSLSFYTGIHDHFDFLLPNGLIASRPGHPILEKILGDLKKSAITDAVISNPNDLIKLVGPGKFTLHVMNYLEKNLKHDKRIVVFPCTFFYPSPASVRSQGIDFMFEFNKPESFANHLWEVSWVKKAPPSLLELAKRPARKVKRVMKRVLGSK